jgi:hypothetical protein
MFVTPDRAKVAGRSFEQQFPARFQLVFLSAMSHSQTMQQTLCGAPACWTGRISQFGVVSLLGWFCRQRFALSETQLIKELPTALME